jgi:lipoprotein NlpI
MRLNKALLLLCHFRCTRSGQETCCGSESRERRDGARVKNVTERGDRGVGDRDPRRASTGRLPWSDILPRRRAVRPAACFLARILERDRAVLVLLALLAQALGHVRLSAAPAQGSPQEVLDRAVADFRNGRLPESAAGFDRLASLVPAQAPQLWQRGIVLYYVGRYQDCRLQFESHRTVNPDDVENAAWHFLCVARAESPEKARAGLLPVGPDARVPMRQIYQMLRGTLTPEQIMAAAGTQPESQFYAHLYVGLYFEALGSRNRALEHIKAAAADRYADVGGYMHMVARVHLGTFKESERR